MAGKIYSPEQRAAALAVLEANGGNIAKTARETGITRPTLMEWLKDANRDLTVEKAQVAEVVRDFLSRVKEVRAKGIEKMATLIEASSDLYQVTGAVKLLDEMALANEVIGARLARETRETGETPKQASIGSGQHAQA